MALERSAEHLPVCGMAGIAVLLARIKHKQIC